VSLTPESDAGNYRPGKIAFHAKKGKSIDLEKLRESIAANAPLRRTSMSVIAGNHRTGRGLRAVPTCT